MRKLFYKVSLLMVRVLSSSTPLLPNTYAYFQYLNTQYFESTIPKCYEEIARWQQIVSKAFWRNPNELKQTYALASILQNGRVVFNIKGNSYRLITDVNYENNAVYIKWFGTHVDYDRIDAQTVEYHADRFSPT